jgi:hypothetical protein
MPTALELVNQNLPTVAKLEGDDGYGWTDGFIETLMETMVFSPAQAVRHFWLQRVNETAEYLDAGKPLTQIHKQARAMLDYWDKIIGTNPDGMGPLPETAKRPLSFGEIERPWDEAASY